MRRNEHLASYNIQIVRRVMSIESHNKVIKELGIAKSTLWGWKCKYAPFIASEFEIKEENKPQKLEDFVDITLVSKETKKSPRQDISIPNCNIKSW